MPEGSTVAVDGDVLREENSHETKRAMFRPLHKVREEARNFKAALAAAPEPQLGWDLAGVRRFTHKAWWLLLHEHSSPGRLAAAVFVGVVIGVSPFYGFHIALALVLAWMLRLNKLVVWLATNVSFPVISPFFAAASIQVGYLIINRRATTFTADDFERLGVTAVLKDLFIYWLIGFPIVGVVVGALLAGVVWGITNARRQTRNPDAPPDSSS
ncbi:MAG: DUF2062 domain-containing protein [Myxococcota bacterium]|nr:DUF2062 domain-containing protein [Myxococcota bacterium]